jgi:DNA primase
LLYGLYQARRAIAEQDEVVVVEGYTDVIGLAQAGVANAVASMGTALTDAQITLMTRFTKNITFMFDADRAGTEAMLRSGELARRRELRPMMAVLPADKDPADIAVNGGAEAIKKVLSTKTSLLGFELRQTLSRADTGSSEGRVRAFEQVRQIMTGATSLMEREEEIAYVADRLHLSTESAKLLLGDSGTARAGGGRGVNAGTPKATDSRPMMMGRLLKTESSIEQDFLVAAACNPQKALPLLEALTPDHFTDDGNREVYGRLLEAFKLMGGSKDTQAAYERLRSHAHGDSDAGRLFVRLVLEADQGHYSTAVLEELNLRVHRQYLTRDINRRQSKLEGGEDIEKNQRRIFQLQRLLKEVEANLANLDPEEGRA